jgi:predicted NAD/FAD-binding protein
MNRLQSLGNDRQYCVTLNRSDAIAPEQVISSREFAHPVFTHRGVAAQRRWAEISGTRRTHYCGAYWGYGFHEDGVESARRVCRAFGVEL